jgi:hypothetical protein
MKVSVSISVNGLMTIDVPEERREAMEQMLEDADGRDITIEAFEEAAGVAWDWDDVLNQLDFEISDIDIPRKRHDRTKLSLESQPR